jgi:ribonuclease HII
MLRNYAKEHNLKLVAGLDEVGRGSFAGPVVTAAVILPPSFESELIVDSKLICKSKSKMQKAYDLIMENALYVHCDAQSAKVINKIGINGAIWKSMHTCISNLPTPEMLLIDGREWEMFLGIPYETVIRGDNTYLSIAAAAIVAKYRRDEYMVRVHEIHPHYNFAGSKGYYCKKHGEGLLEHGRTKYHRTQYVDTWEKNRK